MKQRAKNCRFSSECAAHGCCGCFFLNISHSFRSDANAYVPFLLGCYFVARLLAFIAMLAHENACFIANAAVMTRLQAPSSPVMRINTLFLSGRAHALHRKRRLRGRCGHASGGLALTLLDLHPLAIGLGDSRLTSGTSATAAASASGSSGSRNDSGILLLRQGGVGGAGGCGSGAAAAASATPTGGSVGLNTCGFARRD